MGFSRYWAKHIATNEFKHANKNIRREYAVAAGLSALEPAEINGAVENAIDKRAYNKVVNVGENIGEITLVDNPVK